MSSKAVTVDLSNIQAGCRILAFFARVGGGAAGATFVRPTPPVVYTVAVPASLAYAKDGALASVVWLLQFESRATRTPLGFRNGPALR
jgi:hypothetical protein